MIQFHGLLGVIQKRMARFFLLSKTHRVGLCGELRSSENRLDEKFRFSGVRGTHGDKCESHKKYLKHHCNSVSSSLILIKRWRLKRLLPCLCHPSHLPQPFMNCIWCPLTDRLQGVIVISVESQIQSFNSSHCCLRSVLEWPKVVRNILVNEKVGNPS